MIDFDLNKFHAALLADADRRNLLGKLMNQQKLECPECGTRQVQLIGYINVTPAVWRCRHCKHSFKWEGDKNE